VLDQWGMCLSCLWEPGEERFRPWFIKEEVWREILAVGWDMWRKTRPQKKGKNRGRRGPG
jgi:hypothetical protein